MKLELDRNDVEVVKNLLDEVRMKWQSKTKEMQNDKNCSLENYHSMCETCETNLIL